MTTSTKTSRTPSSSANGPDYRRARTRTGAVIAVAALAAVLAACGTTSSNTGAATTSTGSSTVLSTTVLSTTEMSTTEMSTTEMTGSTTAPMSAAPGTGKKSMAAGADGPFKAADVTFAQQMLVHHQGAVAMADLAPTRAASDKVKALAARIKAEQTPEIEQMSGWLAVWAPQATKGGMSSSAASMSGSMDGMSGMGSDTGSSSAAMPGMMTDTQTSQLTAATGSQFDKLFLQLMIVHHQGALTMARTEKAAGGNTAALALADAIISGQSAEISTMQDLLKGL